MIALRKAGGEWARRGATALAASMAVCCPVAVNAHPHVMVEANLEIMRNDAGEAIELRHVWRFDELFSTTVVLDFDANGNNAMEPDELAKVSETVSKSIAEQEYFTEVRVGDDAVEYKPPKRIMVDYIDGQVLMFFALGFEKPIKMTGLPLKVAVSDPTYYVAMDIPGETAVQVTGKGAACGVDIVVPDYDKLMAQNQAMLTEQFFNNPENADLGDEWLTWVNVACK
jgi:ABC-type uncharacterized transport system substrate-binding protein